MTSATRSFTLGQYASLLELAERRFSFVPFGNIPWNSPFVLWRHDIDFSVNRALRCAEEEHRVGVLATYFINPTSSFYNPFEATQAKLIRNIVALGHRIGLHFDSNGVSPSGLDAGIRSQRQALEDVCGVDVEAVSFHNPKPEHLANDAESYGGLMNAYSRTLMQGVTYSSDSNGYWRHRPLIDVLNDASVSRLQVLTHPGWWQDTEIPPRSRIYRSVYGRASNVMSEYDDVLARDGRENRSGGLAVIASRGDSRPSGAETAEQAVVDFLWHAEAFVALYAFLCGVAAGIESDRPDLEDGGNGPTGGAEGGDAQSLDPALIRSGSGGASLRSMTTRDLAALTLAEARELSVQLLAHIRLMRGQSNRGL